MNNPELEIMGYYEPGLFHLRVNIDEEITDLNSLLNREKRFFSTFLHEYIHFLQEITTTSGIRSTGAMIDMLKDIIWDIRQYKESEFETPVKINNKNNSQANISLYRIYQGDSRSIEYAKYIRYDFESIDVIDNKGNLFKPKKYYIYFYNQVQQLIKYHFGHTCLKEYVTHTIQKKYLPDISHPDIPYVIVELIIDKEYPILSSDPMLIVALCDASMMHFHPVDFFFNSLERMKNENFVPSTTMDIYNYLWGNVLFGSDKINVIDLYKKISEDSLTHIKDALKSDIFKSNRDWLEKIINEGVSLRLSNPDFMTKLVEGHGELSNLFYQIVKKIGTPFFTNKQSKGNFIPPDDGPIPDQPYQLMVFKEILKIFWGSSVCSLYDFCKSRNNDITNHHCQNSPWERGSEEELCPLGQLWKTWGLVGKNPNKNNNQ